MSSNAPDINVPDSEELRDRFSRIAATLIVVGTLAGAVVGFLQTSAGRQSSAAGVAAQRYATQAMGQLLRAQQSAQVDFENYALADRQRRLAASARQRFIFLTGPYEQTATLAQDRWEQLATQTAELTAITADRPDGPVLDPGFPTEFFANSIRGAVRLRALQDAANEADGAWSSKESTYTAILTLFAVALYLLGLSLTVTFGIKRMFAGLGLALVVLGSGWAAVVAASSPEAPSETAADAFASGHVKLQSAGSRAQYQAAVADFDRAIELRPTFGQAYQERSEAIVGAGSPQAQGALSVIAPEALEASTRDLEKALELGVENQTVLGNLGFHAFLEGLNGDSDEPFERSVGYTRRAMEINPRNPIFGYNLGVALLATGEVEEARAAYEDAIGLTIYSDVGEQVLRQDPGTEQFYVAGALTDLELLVGARPDVAGPVQELKELIVGSASLGMIGIGETAVEIGAIDVAAFPAEVQWQADLPNYDAATDVVSQQWYYRDPSGLGWASLPNVSGVVTPTEEDDGGFFVLRSWLASSFPPSCLREGTYRVELYVNGRLLSTGESEVALPELSAYVPRDLNAAMCRPTDWVRSEHFAAGWYDGFVSEANDAGVYVFRWSPPRADATFDLLDGTIDIFSNFFPGKPVFDESLGTDTDFFLSLENPRKRWYDYPGGDVRAGAGLADDGSVIVAVVFGPDDMFDEDGDLGLRIFDSIIELEPLGT